MHIGNYTHCIKEGGLVQVNDISLKCKQCILVIVNILKNLQTMHFGNCKHSLLCALHLGVLNIYYEICIKNYY